MKARHLLAIGMLSTTASITTQGYEADWFSGKILIDGRIRYEVASQTGVQQSDASTYRLRMGYEAALTEGIVFLAEGEGTMDLQLGTYDAYPGSQGEPGHAVIADPQNLELNRLQIAMDFSPVTAVLGRQRIIRNNARFVGNVGWRQNEQTFDAVGLNFSPVEEVSIYYAYMDAANRIFGIRSDSSVQRQFELESHIIEAQYAASSGLKAGLYGYLLGIQNSAANSSDTYGVWASGAVPLGEDNISLNWRAEYAQQSDNSFSVDGAEFDLGYYHVTVAVAQKGSLGLTLGYEVLEGDGSRGFSTPLATLHAFNGFADVFLGTPSTGLEDLYLKATTQFTDKINGAIFYHDFQADQGSADYGTEIDVVCGWKITDKVSATAKAAFFDGKNRPDVTKFWLQMDMKY